MDIASLIIAIIAMIILIIAFVLLFVQPGKKGPAGANGSEGGTGPTGSIIGNTGVQGPQGPEGPQGPQGDTGVQGAQGPSSSGGGGITGMQGPQGENGAQGPQGVEGDTGSFYGINLKYIDPSISGGVVLGNSLGDLQGNYYYCYNTGTITLIYNPQFLPQPGTYFYIYNPSTKNGINVTTNNVNNDPSDINNLFYYINCKGVYGPMNFTLDKGALVKLMYVGNSPPNSSSSKAYKNLFLTSAYINDVC